jgi:carbamoyltransferase
MLVNKNKTNWFLGLNIGMHDSSAALLKKDRIFAVSAQERFSRRKSAHGEAPIDAVKFCLAKANITLDDVTAIGLGSDIKLLNQWLGTKGREVKENQKLDDPDRLFPRNVFQFKKLPPIIPIRHHLAHAASSFWASGMKEAAVLVLDNRGEDCSGSLAFGSPKEIKIFEQIGVERSLGIYYRAAAQYAGLCGKFREVGKFMGLASYGVPIENVPLKISEDGYFFEGIEIENVHNGIEIPRLLTGALFNYFQRECFPFYKGKGLEIMAFSNFAASVQKSLEAAILSLCRKLKRETGAKNLALSGGVGLNCTANGVIANSGIFEHIYIQPAAGDDGVALGAAFEVSRMLSSGFSPTKMSHAYWGPEYSDESIEKVLKEFEVEYKFYDEDVLIEKTAEELANFKIVGWFQGRAEFGPRALGARSILANPTKRDSLIKVNNIKLREVWRPLAPSVLEEKAELYFEGKQFSPFMIVASQVKKEKRKQINAAVHIDGSARPQLVSKKTNLRYWKLIRSFEKRSGVPVILNTSFNKKKEPIVNSPADAVRCFLSSGIDVLAIGNALVYKK